MRDAQGTVTYLKDYRVPDYLIDETHLDFQLFEDRTLVASRLLMRRNPDSGGKGALVLDGAELELLDLKVDGRLLSEQEYRTDEESLTVFELPDTFTLECRTLIHPENNTSLEGLYKSKRMFCTQCEAEGFRKITYYLDRPDVLSSFSVRIEAEQARYPVLLSNGNRVASGEGEQEGRHWVQWQDPFKKPCYLFALVAGNLQSLDDSFTTCSGRDISLQIFVEEKDLDKCDFAMRSLKKAMKWDEEVYGREYDLDTFMIVAVDDFNMGAMENKGLNIFNTSCVLANPATATDLAFQRIEAVVAHEYFHNWSGNRVTCRDWFQLSLKEGFTVYRDAEFSADMGSRAVKRIEDVSFLRTVQFAEDSGPMAHPVRPESYMEISNFYTVTIYEKGAEVVRMMARLLGPERFRAGTDLYFERFDGMAVTTEDFVRCMEDVSALDLGQFRRWYTQAGTPVLKVEGRYDREAETYTLEVRQSCKPSPGQPVKEPYYIPLAMALLDAGGRELPLILSGESEEQGGGNRVLAITRSQESFVFTGIKEEPVPSLLRGFSAPVKLHFDYSRDQLMFLLSHDHDGFTRWEAAQTLGLSIIHELLDSHQASRELVLDQRLVEAYRSVLQASLDQPGLDKAMVADLIVLPKEAYVSELAGEIDVDGIHRVREFIREEIARKLRDLLVTVYEVNDNGEAYQVDAGSIARRKLKNTVLAYLMALDDESSLARCHRQYRQADNMTDVSTALRQLVNCQMASAESLKTEALAEFYRQWRHEALVVDQWLTIQAGACVPGSLDKVKALVAHEAFDIKNPNKVRAVLGTFCSQNPVAFHAEDGSGYAFLADHVLQLNGLNPQIAARLLTPLTRWRKYNANRQHLMLEQLQRIMAQPDLSKDVYEVVSKSLNLEGADKA